MSCERSNLIIYCSDSDRIEMEKCYPVSKKGLDLLVENGAATSTISYQLTSERNALKQRLVGNRTVGIFLASWHQPNIEAVRHLSKIAEITAEYTYIIVGSVGDYFKNSGDIMSKNIIFTGLVTTLEKDILLQISDFGMNPMSTGSGTNIKMFDYMAAGLPIVSTYVGARGLDLPEGIAWIGELKDFPSLISSAKNSGRNINRRLFARERFDWDAIGIRYRESINSLSV